ncbi:MAG: lipopolysaccharide heptosyltransferase II, partial [Thiothrix sp.]
MNVSPQRCLIIGPSWVGDMVMAHSLFMALRANFPALQIDVLAPAWSKPLLTAMPEVNQALEMPLQHGELGLGKRYRLGKTLRDNAYDWAIVLPGSFKAALVPFWANIPVRTGYRGEWRYGLLNDIRPLDKNVLTMTIQRFVALGLPAATPLPPSVTPPRLQVTAEQKTVVQQQFLRTTPSPPLLALCPGAEYGSAKRWLPEYFAAVARYQIANGGTVILLGSGKDAALTAAIAAAVPSPRCLDLAGKTSLAEAMALLALADKVVSNDSG